MNFREAPHNWNRGSTFKGIPIDEGFYFPAEWEEHESTWLSWPHNKDTWPGMLEKVFTAYCEFIRLLAEGEKVKINVRDRAMAEEAFAIIEKADADMSQVYFYVNPTNDAWCRDHGPAFLLNKKSNEKLIVDWEYNAWGEKYPPFHLDNDIPLRIAHQLKLPFTQTGIVMEGGSVDFNGNGTVITTRSCLLNRNRNPLLTKVEIEQNLKNYYGVHQIIWLDEGIIGDDTDGHIDDITRFVNENTVVTVVEDNPNDENYELLKKNRIKLEKCMIGDSPLRVINLPMPKATYYGNMRLPMSYANFYISNKYVIVPIFEKESDDAALSILEDCFPGREVIGINSLDIIMGLGSFHCLSQQEPKVKY